MYAGPNPCTPQRHHGGCRRRRDLKDPSRMKAPARPVLKDPSWVNSPMGGYAGGLDCSHSQTALAKRPAAKTTERGERLDPDTQSPSRSGGPAAAARARLPSSRLPCVLRQKCRFATGAMPLHRDSASCKNVAPSYGGCHYGPENTRKSRRSLPGSCRGRFRAPSATKNRTGKNVAGVKSLYTPRASRKGPPTQGPVGPLI